MAQLGFQESMSEISVVICVHNRMKFLAETLGILEKQTVAPEVIVVDDGEAWSLASWPCVQTYIHQRPDGLYNRVAKFNLGVRLATTPIVILLDDDCIPQSADFCAAYLESSRDAYVVRGMFLDGADQKLTPWFSTANIGFARGFFNELGGFDVRYDGRYGYEDVDMEKMIAMTNVTVNVGSAATAVLHVGESFSGDRVAAQINERLYREKWGL